MADQDDVDVTLGEFRAGFRRSAKGNMWTTFFGQSVTVFRHRNGKFAWCIADADDGDGEKQFSEQRFDTEDAALFAVARIVGVI